MTKPIASKAKRNSNNTTGFHGVTQLPNGKFIAQIFHNGKTIRAKDQRNKPAEAARDYDKLAVELKGDKAKLNFPPKAVKAAAE